MGVVAPHPGRVGGSQPAAGAQEGAPALAVVLAVEGAGWKGGPGRGGGTRRGGTRAGGRCWGSTSRGGLGRFGLRRRIEDGSGFRFFDGQDLVLDESMGEGTRWNNGGKCTGTA